MQRWMYITLFIVASVQATHAQILIIDKSFSEKKIGKYCTLFEDKTSQLTINEILTANNALKFQPNKKKSYSFGYSKSAFWIKFKLTTNDLNEKVYFDVGIPAMDYVFMYIVDNGKIIQTYKSGDHYVFKHRPIKNRHVIYPIKLSPKKKLEVYLRYQSSSTIKMPLRLWREKNFLNHIQNKQIYYGLYLGIILIMAFYNVFIYISVRERSYLYYVVYLFNLIVFQFSVSGIGFQYLWPNWLWMANNASAIFAILTFLFSLLFTSSILNTKENFPKLHLTIKISSSVFSVQLLVSLFLPVYIINQFTLLTGFIGITVILVTAIYAALARIPSSGYFLAAWASLLIGGIIFILELSNIISASLFSENALQIGSILEVCLLSLALANKVNTLKAENHELETQMKIAQKIQKAIIPDSSPVMSGVDMAFFYQPMMGVGGDFIDFIKRGKSEIGIIICDVSGHGVPAALLASMVKMSLHYFWKDYLDKPSEVLSRLRDSLMSKMGSHFITALTCYINTSTGEMKVAKAGHEPLTILRKDGKLELVSPSGTVIMEEFTRPFDEETIKLNQGDQFFLYTDGITEAHRPNQEQFGENRLIESLRSMSTSSALEICKQFQKIIMHYIGNHENISDDITFMAFKYNGSQLTANSDA